MGSKYAGQWSRTKPDFWANVDKGDGSGCWIWKGAVSHTGGYGVYRCKHAHRIVYELCIGPIPEGKLIRHKCDIRPCVNPDHLIVGTNKENARDAYERGRTHNQRRRRAEASFARALNLIDDMIDHLDRTGRSVSACPFRIRREYLIAGSEGRTEFEHEYESLEGEHGSIH